MRITQRERGGVSILDLDGKLSIGGGDVAFRETLETLLASGETMILVNLRGLRSMDSSGLGELLAAKAAAAVSGATIKLLHVEDKVRQVISLTHLIGVFETFDDEIDAIASFSQT